MSFDDISPIVGRSPAAARQLASRARRRVRGRDAAANADVKTQRQVVEAFLAAAREGNFDALLGVLDPAVVRRADAAALPPGAPRELRGAGPSPRAHSRAHAGPGRRPALALISGRSVSSWPARAWRGDAVRVRDAGSWPSMSSPTHDRLRGLDVRTTGLTTASRLPCQHLHGALGWRRRRRHGEEQAVELRTTRPSSMTHSAQVVFEVLHALGARDGYDVVPLSQNPGQRELLRACSPSVPRSS
jgi:hypothetical protein